SVEGLQRRVIAGDPDGLDISAGENLCGLRDVARAGNGDFFQLDAALGEEVAGDADDFSRVRFGAVVQSPDGFDVGNELANYLDGIGDRREGADAGHMGQVVGA